MTASLGGLDVLVFTGGVGERSPEVRTRTVAGLGFLGAHLDETRNQSVTTDAQIGAEQAPVRTLVLRRARGSRDRAAGQSCSGL